MIRQAVLSLKNCVNVPFRSLMKRSIKILLIYRFLINTIFAAPQTTQNSEEPLKKTRSRQVAIGERRKPNAEGKPGYIQVDTVHQGDQDGIKGVYHINSVDGVTQYEVVLSESKNASVIRKTFGYSHIEQYWADELNVFNRGVSQPFSQLPSSLLFSNNHY